MGQYIYTANWFPIINGTFDADTDWIHGANWVIAGGVATSLNPFWILQQMVPFHEHYSYRIEFDIVALNPPNPPPLTGLFCRLWSFLLPVYNTVGHKTFDIQDAKDRAGNGLTFNTNFGMTGAVIDNVVVTELDTQIGVAYNLVPIKGTLLEHTPISPTKAMTNYARVNGGTSCLIVYNPQQVDT